MAARAQRPRPLGRMDWAHGTDAVKHGQEVAAVRVLGPARRSTNDPSREVAAPMATRLRSSARPVNPLRTARGIRRRTVPEPYRTPVPTPDAVIEVTRFGPPFGTQRAPPSGKTPRPG